MTFWPCCRPLFLRYLTYMQKVEKERALLTEDKIEVSAESVWASADTVGPILSLSQKKK